MPDGPERPRAGGLARLVRRLRRRRFRVADRSMAPALLPGDCLYVDRGAYRRAPPARGEIVVVQDPVEPSRHLVKRVAFVPRGAAPPDGTIVAPGYVYLLGDDPTTSRDSREFGAVPDRLVLGRAYFCYRPLERRRDL